MSDIVDTIEMPDQDGKSPGDLWYGLPINPTLATHVWNGREWRPLLTEEDYYKAEITALRAEVERLKEWNREIALNAREFVAENEKLNEAMEMLLTDVRRTDVDMCKLKTESENLRAALKNCIEILDDLKWSTEAVERARAALGEPL